MSDRRDHVVWCRFFAASIDRRVYVRSTQGGGAPLEWTAHAKFACRMRSDEAAALLLTIERHRDYVYGAGRLDELEPTGDRDQGSA